MTYTLHCGDCLDVMRTLPAQSVDAIIADIPYGTTACKWDSVIPFAPMWECIKHVIKQRGAVVLFGSQPFTSALVMSNPKWFKYEWIWQKSNGTNGLNAKGMPIKIHENISVFCDGVPTYNPQKFSYKSSRFQLGEATGYNNTEFNRDGAIRGKGIEHKTPWSESGERYPLSVVYHRNNNINGFNGSVAIPNFHPTQKPVELMSFLVKTYTNEGETVLDFTMGSGSTGVACVQEGRNFIGIEQLPEYVEIARQRLEQATQQIPLLQVETCQP
jgi:DNA modification methylase